MKLHQLEALVASADAGSIRGAARALGLSQAAITRALRELEANEQLPLLIRAPTTTGAWWASGDTAVMVAAAWPSVTRPRTGPLAA